MRIAVIGTGIAGNAAAWALATGSRHEVTVFERAPRAGGHCATVEVDYEGERIAVDTGFMVYNDLNYPNLTELFRLLGVATQPTRMSFSVSVDDGAFEWAGDSENRISRYFAQRRNLISPAHFRMLGDIVRFNRDAVRDLAEGRLTGLALGEYLDRGGYSARFRDDYLLAMGAAIWSTSPAKMLGFPAETYVAFCENHRLVHWTRPVWRTVTGGSRRYVDKLTASFAHRIRYGTPVSGVRRNAEGVEVATGDGRVEPFDAAVIAAHSDQALAMLADAGEDERAILGAIVYAPNEIVLHRDPALMPKRRQAWSSWNLIKPQHTSERAAVTYWMNAIQGIRNDRPLFVSLNPQRDPRPELTFGRFTYEHPQYDQAALAAQRRLPSIQGRNRLWFCGAWTGYGFHEDGLVSGLAAAEALGAEVPWRVAERRLPMAAE
ncbi:MAG TPA: FAD-dependent oxidoreductase [Microvirga sp.]|jgi:predicted NAD/FAD-binding protein